MSSAPVFKCWADVPDAPTADLLQFKWFVEVFAGKGWLTRAMRRRGWGILPPIDITVAGEVLVAADILDPVFHAKLTAWLSSGAARLAHFGTPCTSFSIARRYDGGPNLFAPRNICLGSLPFQLMTKKLFGWGQCCWTARSIFADRSRRPEGIGQSKTLQPPCSGLCRRLSSSWKSSML